MTCHQLLISHLGVPGGAAGVCKPQNKGGSRWSVKTGCNELIQVLQAGPARLHKRTHNTRLEQGMQAAVGPLAGLHMMVQRSSGLGGPAGSGTGGQNRQVCEPAQPAG